MPSNRVADGHVTTVHILVIDDETGAAYCQHVVKIYRGIIQVNSGRGSKFIVHLPLFAPEIGL